MKLLIVICSLIAAVSVSQANEPTESRRALLMTYENSMGERVPVRSAQDWQLKRRAILKGMQEVMGQLPIDDHDAPITVVEGEKTTGAGYQRQTLRLQINEHDQIPVDLYLPDPLPEHKIPGVLALHQTGEHGKRLVSDENLPGAQGYAIDLVKRGYVVLAPDYPSFGEYPFDFEASDLPSGTMKGIINHIRCVDYLASLKSVDAERLGAVGHSLGGHNAMFLAAFDERIKATIASCAWTPFHDYYEGDLTGWTSPRYMPRIRDVYDLDAAKVPFDMDEVAAAIAPRGFFSNSPEFDENFAVSGVNRVADSISDVYTLLGAHNHFQVRYPHTGHDFPQQIRQEAYAFLDRLLSHRPVIMNMVETAPKDYAEELPRLNPLEPEEALTHFEIFPDLQIEQTATEPLVTSPVAMSFDEAGRLYVVEMIDYSEQDKEHLGQIRLLEDLNGDGIFDRSTVFAEGLSWPTAIHCFDGGVFVGAPPYIYYLKDHDGDLKADEKRLVFDGFGRGNVQGLMNSFRWGLDNRIHASTSSSGGTATRPDDPEFGPVELRGRDFSFDPRLLDLRAESGASQHGMSFDDWGRKFVCSNSRHAMHVKYDDRYFSRNPYLISPASIVEIADDGGQAPVYRISPVEPWRIVRTRLRVSGESPGMIEGGGRAAGYFTSATGITIYQGDAMPEEYRGLAIIGDVGSNIIHRKKIVPKGLSFVATRLDSGTEFIRSDDNWFRPVQFANAPDGCLHILDMYREVIEHPASVPPEIKQHLDLTSGRHRGRLYRVYARDKNPRTFTSLVTLTSAELVPLLGDSNGWHRETANRLLFERQDLSVIPALRVQAMQSDNPLARLHSLSALSGLKGLDEEVIVAALNNSHSGVREFALKLSESFSDSQLVQAAVSKRVDDDSLRVRFQLALTAGEFPMEWKVDVLSALLKQFPADSEIRLAALSSSHPGAAELLVVLLDDEEFRTTAGGETTIQELAGLIARAQDEAGMLTVLTKLKSVAGQQSLPVKTITALLQSPVKWNSQQVNDELQTIRELMLNQARENLKDDSTAAPVRIEAIQALAFSDESADLSLLLEQLESSRDVAVQSEVFRALTRYSQAAVAEEIIALWSGLTPALRAQAEELLFSRGEWLPVILTALEEQQLPLSEIRGDRLRSLEGHSSSEIQKRVAALLKNSGSQSRMDVIDQYQSAITMKGDIRKGREVFRKECATCHRLEEVGYEIGPHLATLQNRGAEAILLNILDPSREVNPQYLNYVVQLTDGRILTGMIHSESATSLTLVRGDQQSDTILRSDVELIRSTGLSLMPEGLEQRISPESMADLIAYLMSVR